MFFSPPVTHDVILLRVSKTLNRSGSTYPKDFGKGRELLRISCLHCISCADIRTAPPWGEFWRSRSVLSGQIINRIAFSNSHFTAPRSSHRLYSGWPLTIWHWLASQTFGSASNPINADRPIVGRTSGSMLPYIYAKNHTPAHKYTYKPNRHIAYF